MLGYARLDATHGPHGPLADSAPLDRFQVFNKNWPTAYTYDYYSTPSYDAYAEPEIDSATNVYHTLVNSQYLTTAQHDEWKTKIIDNWTEDDTMSWYIDTLRCLDLNEFEWPTSKFRIPGIALRGMSRDQIIDRMSSPRIDPTVYIRYGDKVYERLQQFTSLGLHPMESNPYQSQDPPQTVLDLDSYDNRQQQRLVYDYNQEQNFPQMGTDSSNDDAQDYFRDVDSASPSSDVSKSGDEMEDKKKVFKRPPGRPKGSGRKSDKIKRARSESVPEFLKNLILNPKYCPSIIKWEDYNKGLFRFVKPDEVAKLWGIQKQNDHMTFEKFSRAMRYHYKNCVLGSVPSQRLVYQFGPKGPDYRTDNPNFVKVKSEYELHSENIYS
ncbi:ETS homologous factor [Plutella xylostella]|uniref:ETS homologous factor n=1 Tax=Plutella xylostella TaxID=51655 RepID=UPI002032961C|nr:ETS homologous factor [Plutella xylostella]